MPESPQGLGSGHFGSDEKLIYGLVDGGLRKTSAGKAGVPESAFDIQLNCQNVSSVFYSEIGPRGHRNLQVR